MDGLISVLRHARDVLIARLTAICNKGAPISAGATAGLSVPSAMANASGASLVAKHLSVADMGIMVSGVCTIVLTVGTLYFKWRADKRAERAELAGKLVEVSGSADKD